MKKIKTPEKEIENNWEIEEAMSTLKKYAELVKNKKLKEDAIARLEEEANKYKEVAKDLSN